MELKLGKARFASQPFWKGMGVICGAAEGNEPLLLWGLPAWLFQPSWLCWHSSAWGRSYSADPIALGASELQGAGLMWCEEKTSSRQVESKPAKRAEQSVQKLPWTVFVPTASPQDKTE